MLRMSSKKIHTQSSLHSFFGVSKEQSKKEAESRTATGKNENLKENKANDEDLPPISTTSVETNVSVVCSEKEIKSKALLINDGEEISDERTCLKKRKRRVIEESSDDEDDVLLSSKTCDDKVSEMSPDTTAASTTELLVKKSVTKSSKNLNLEAQTPDVGTGAMQLSGNEDDKCSEQNMDSVAEPAIPASKVLVCDKRTKILSSQKLDEIEKSIPNDKIANRPVSAIMMLTKDQFPSDVEVLKSISEDWKKEMPYSVLCKAFAKIEAITSRLQIQEIMTFLFRQIMLKNSSDMSIVLYLASNSVAPAYDCVELGIGDAVLIKAIGEATGTNPSMVKQRYETEGDLGTVAQSLKSKQRTLGGFFAAANPAATKSVLTAEEVLTTYRKIAHTKGNQSQKFKVDSIKRLLVKASDPEETKYIIRGLQGKLRIGLAQSTVLISLAHSLALTTPTVFNPEETHKFESDGKNLPEEAKQYFDKSQTVETRLLAAVNIVKKAYSEVPSYEAILAAAFKVPLQFLHRECTLTPGIPVAPMLAKPTKSVKEVLKRLNGLKFTVEYKYDGERAQIHMLPNGTTKVFSRNLLDTSEKYPEVPLFVKEACKNVESCVLDAEVVAFNNKTGQLVPFQILSTRKKTEESAETAKVQVIVQAFDLMYLNGESMLNHTLSERRALMKQHFDPVEGKFQFATYLDHEENGDTAVIEEFLESAVKGQCEGLMVKTLDVNAIYEPSRRSLNWLKLKKDYLEGLGDSVDLVPIGAYHGRGKRTGVYGAYLLACYDPETEEFQSVCKIGTGFSDEDLQTLSDNLNKHKIATKNTQYNVSDQLECDVWFDAVQVWEVKAADLSKSSAHRGAVGKTGEQGRGIGLRFPRFERLRDDKKPEDATTSDQILEMYYEQDAIVAGDDDNDDDGI